MSDRAPADRPRGAHAAIASVVVVATTLFLFAPLFEALARGRAAYFEWDVSEQYWPDLVFLCGALHEGELPSWNPYDRGGYPFHADPQAAPYHPLNLALCALGANPPLGLATARVVLGFLLSGLFALGWLRRTGFGWSGATVGATLMTCAPFQRHNWELNLTSALAYLPAMLWACELVVQERRPRDGLLLAFTFALCAWTGSPPALFFASTFVLLYGLARVARTLRETPASARTGALVALTHAGATFALFAAGFVAVVFVPGLELSRHSVQAGRAFSDLASGGLADLSPLLSPRSGNHLYVGLLPLALAPFALRARAVGSALALAAGSLSVALAMGDEGPLFRWAFDHLPGVDLFRLPHRYEAWLGPCAALLCAGGLDALSRREAASAQPGERWKIAALTTRGKRTRRTLSFGIASLALGAWLVTVDWPTFEHHAGPGLLALCAGVIALTRWTGQLPTAGVGALLALLVVTDVTQALPSDRHLRVGPPPGGVEVAREVLTQTEGLGSAHAAMDEFAIGLRAGTRLRFPELRGYQDPLTLRSHERVLAALHDTPQLAAQFGVAFALQGPHYLHGWNRHFLPRALPGARVDLAGTRSVTRIPGALPLVYVVPRTRSVLARSRQEALARVRAVAPTPLAIVEDPEAPLALADDENSVTAQPASAVELGRDHLRLVVDARTEGYVVVNQAWYPGWVAEVDGELAPVHRANGFVRAVPVRAGRHRVELRFEPAAAWTRKAWAATWLLALAWLVRVIWCRRRAANVARHAR